MWLSFGVWFWCWTVRTWSVFIIIEHTVIRCWAIRAFKHIYRFLTKADVSGFVCFPNTQGCVRNLLTFYMQKQFMEIDVDEFNLPYYRHLKAAACKIMYSDVNGAWEPDALNSFNAPTSEFGLFHLGDKIKMLRLSSHSTSIFTFQNAKS